ncbi:MAG: rRNA maturation RNase YbeY [Alphaproteobacteria bacterium]
MHTSGRSGARRPRPKREKARKGIPRARITLVIEDQAWRSDTRAVALARRAAVAGLASAGTRARPCTLLLSSDAHLKELNHLFLGKNAATNVLSFPSRQPDYLGDVAIAFGVAAGEAHRQGKPLAHHVAHLALHGVLHLLGYNHEDERDAETMERVEARILARLGIANPYLVREAA